MKYLLKTVFVIFLSLMFFACSEDTQNDQVNLVDNSENISKLIGSFDLIVKKSIENPKLNDEELGKLFIEESEKSGLTIVEINTNNAFAKSSTENSTFSDTYLAFSNEIQNANNFLTKEEYKDNLNNLNNSVLNSSISIEEKQILVDNIGFMVAFVDWMDTLETQTANKSSFLAKSDCDGWWSCWGKCAAGTIGGAITGAIAGCGVGGSVGAAAGAAIGSLAGGVGAIPGAGVGAVVGCAAGGVAGAIGGGLTGAAAACD